MATVAALDDARVVAALRRGDEATFVARGFVGSAPVAEDVARQTWGVVLERLDSFGGETSLTTWIVGITVAEARERATERPLENGDDEPTIDPSRFLPP